MTRYPKTILITGGAGFIGHTVVIELLKAGNKVIVIDDLSKGKRENLPTSTNLYLYIADICDDLIYKKIEQEHKEIDSIIHLAAIHFIPDCNLNYKKTLETNVAGTGKIIQWANDNKINKIVFASSASVYGSYHTKPIKESAPALPNDIYGQSKLLAESLFRLFKNQSIILRLFNVFGPNETHNHLIPAVINQIKSSNEIRIGNLSPKRDYVYVDDVRDAILTALNYEGDSNIFNIGSGVATSVEEVIKKIKNLSNSEINITILSELQRKVDTPYLCADTTQIRRIMNWKPSYFIDSGLDRIMIDFIG